MIQMTWKASGKVMSIIRAGATNMVGNKKLPFGAATLTLLVLLGFVGCEMYVRSGTTQIQAVASPDREWEAVLMVRNGGAMSDFSTQVSVLRADKMIVREMALFRVGNVFIADSDHGSVLSGNQGQIEVRLNWISSTELGITYPGKARVFKKESRIGPVNLVYSTSE